MDATPVEILALWSDLFVDPSFDIFETLEMLGLEIILNGSKQMIIRWRYVRCVTFGVLWPLFFQCLVEFHQLLFIANNCDRFTRFQQLVVYHTFFIPLNTQHHLLSMNIAFWSWWFTWQYPFVVCDFHNKPFLHRQSQFDAKMTFFRIVQAAIHKSFFVFRVVSRSIHVVTSFPLFKPVQDYVNVC